MDITRHMVQKQKYLKFLFYVGLAIFMVGFVTLTYLHFDYTEKKSVILNLPRVEMRNLKCSQTKNAMEQLELKMSSPDLMVSATDQDWVISDLDNIYGYRLKNCETDEKEIVLLKWKLGEIEHIKEEIVKGRDLEKKFKNEPKIVPRSLRSSLGYE